MILEQLVPEPTSWTDAQWVQAVVVTTAVLTLAGLLWRYLVRPGMVLARRVGEFLEDWQGTPARPGVPARPGAMERLRQLENNGGLSMTDTVDATRRLAEQTHALAQATHEDQRRQWTAIRHLARFHEEQPDPPGDDV